MNTGMGMNRRNEMTSRVFDCLKKRPDIGEDIGCEQIALGLTCRDIKDVTVCRVYAKDDTVFVRDSSGVDRCMQELDNLCISRVLGELWYRMK